MNRLAPLHAWHMFLAPCALQVLDSLIAEDDSVPNVWYMLAMCLLGGGDVEAAEEALQQGQLLLTKKHTDADDLVKEFSALKVRLDVASF